MKKSVSGVIIRRTLALVAILALWEYAAGAREWVDPFDFPRPLSCGCTLAGLFLEGKIYPRLEATFTAAFAGLILGVIAGVILGFIAALIPFLAELIEPLMVLFNAIPRVILAPLLIIWLGIGVGSKVALSFILVVVIIFFAVYNGIRNVDTQLVERVRTLGGNGWMQIGRAHV